MSASMPPTHRLIGAMMAAKSTYMAIAIILAVTAMMGNVRRSLKSDAPPVLIMADGGMNGLGDYTKHIPRHVALSIILGTQIHGAIPLNHQDHHFDNREAFGIGGSTKVNGKICFFSETFDYWETYNCLAEACFNQQYDCACEMREAFKASQCAVLIVDIYFNWGSSDLWRCLNPWLKDNNRFSAATPPEYLSNTVLHFRWGDLADRDEPDNIHVTSRLSHVDDYNLFMKNLKALRADVQKPVVLMEGYNQSTYPQFDFDHIIWGDSTMADAVSLAKQAKYLFGGSSGFSDVLRLLSDAEISVYPNGGVEMEHIGYLTSHKSYELHHMDKSKNFTVFNSDLRSMHCSS